MRRHGNLDHDKDLNEAAWVAARGAAVGAATWGIGTAILAGAGYAFSPVYRGLTVQFKVFLQMSGMILGSMVEADRRLVAHEQFVRRQKRLVRDTAVWRRFEEDYEEEAKKSGDGAAPRGEPAAGADEGSS
ncbi:hypothetical protein K490DRAFT_65421 [Saccharata proteae CBS 121410]|uniref:Imidazoleglycerol-phosphate dehydratase n=1 Tax=Saccharata proteae CBS 121410 TaxID=1314787 RepID=A0A9P4HYK4_9PEZI|nr:hypothetical protein K490DRAFT_65421 [Saccharata proteae CBS 121410]